MTRARRALPLAAGPLLLAAGCGLIPPSLDDEPPPLADLEEPLTLVEEPADEAQRLDLPAGGFTGVHVGDARTSLEAMMGEPEGLLVTRVVENSPAVAAGLEPGDVLLTVEVVGEAGGPRALAWPSEWREVELAAEPGTRLRLEWDRAGADRSGELVVAERLVAPERVPGERFREERRVGVVVRTATEVEARAAGLGPGGGAVVVGLAATSPWRAADIRFGDLIASVDGRAVAHPQVVLDAIRVAPAGDALRAEVFRDGEPMTLELPLSRRTRRVREVYVPLLFRYTNDGGRRETSALLGLFRYTTTPAAWRLRLLWLLRFSGGDEDRLVKVEG